MQLLRARGLLRHHLPQRGGLLRQELLALRALPRIQGDLGTGGCRSVCGAFRPFHKRLQSCFSMRFNTSSGDDVLGRNAIVGSLAGVSIVLRAVHKNRWSTEAPWLNAFDSVNHCTEWIEHPGTVFELRGTL